MRIFLDTANIDEIREAAKLGVLSGVTTNPTLMAKERGVEYRERVVEICEVVNGPVSAECIARDVPGIIAEAREVAGWHPDVVVKIPIDAPGLEATAKLAKEGVNVNMTLVFSANQALLAALAGAAYISPFVGRLDDAGHDGMEVVSDTVEILDRYRLPSQVIAASSTRK
jgi:transaldolase